MGKSFENQRIDFDMLCRLFRMIYDDFANRSYFQEAFGYYCVDAGYVDGTVGSDIGAYIFRKIRRDVWPIKTRILDYTEEDIFDFIELLYDLVSKPLDGRYHEYSDCGWHYNTFDKEAGREDYRKEINEILIDYGEGYELNLAGEIIFKGDLGLDELLDEESPNYDKKINETVQHAISLFRRHRASVEDKRSAVRSLAGVLESLRPELDQVITKKDEKDLFMIANKFCIRHDRLDQQKDYDQELFLKWVYYWYLATIRLALEVISRRK